MSAQKITIQSKNGDILLGLAWHVDNSIANVIIMEGMEEHARRYDDFANFLNTKGFNVYAVDAYGQGENVLPEVGHKPLLLSSGKTFSP